MKVELHAEHLTVEYGWDRQMQTGVLLCRFPSTGEDNDEVLIIGTPDQLRGVADSIAAMADDVEDEDD